ncbi:MAG: hypothetical protein ACLQFT_20705 [Steroidobacteraceae bacterium]
MNQAVFGAVVGIVGVVIGSFLTLLRETWSDSRMRARHARYLAIRVVCTLDKYVENCAEVVSDDGLCMGQRDKEGCLQAQVPTPPPLAFPDGLDWKSIDHALMYRLLSMPNEAEAADRKIDFVSQYVAGPPDFEEFFEERRDKYATLGLAAFALTQEMRTKYDIPQQTLGEWNPAERLAKAKEQVEKDRRDRMQRLAASPLL